MTAQLAVSATDVRAGGRWRRGQAAKNAAIRWGIRALLWVADALPESVLVACGRSLGRLTAMNEQLASVTRQNISLSFGNERANPLTAECFSSVGETLAHTLLLRRPGARASRHVELDATNCKRLQRALQQGKGALVLSAHYGPFEHIAAVVAENGIAATVLVRESYDPALDSIVDSHRLRHGVQVAHRGRSPLGVLSALRRGRAVGLLVDLPGRFATESVRFLGAPQVAFPRGPALLATRLAVPVLVALLHPKPQGGFRLVFEELNCPPDELTQRVADRIDAHVRAYPQHWLWMARPLSTPGRG